MGFASATENNCAIPCPVDGLATGLIGYSRQAPGVGETYTYALMVNGFASALVCQTAGGAATTSEDIVNQVALIRNDLISIRITTSAGAIVGYHAASIRVKA